MCGREPKFGSISPASAAACASSPYRTPPATRTVHASVSKSISAGMACRDTRSASLAATVEKECRVPSARIRGVRATRSCNCSIDVGAYKVPGP
jgi:hypothetical protein